jgi:predicted DNA-binding antitoxin AbrB/MazE fold protein
MEKRLQAVYRNGEPLEPVPLEDREQVTVTILWTISGSLSEAVIALREER